MSFDSLYSKLVFQPKNDESYGHVPLPDPHPTPTAPSVQRDDALVSAFGKVWDKGALLK